MKNLLLTTALACASVPAFAEEAANFYAGVQIGQTTADATETDVNGGVTSTDIDLDTSGAHIGYSFGDVYGANLAAEIAYNDLEGDLGAQLDLITARALVGMSFDKILPYISVGFSHISTPDTNNDGYTYGLGVNYLVTDKITVGVEYSQHTFKDIDGSNEDQVLEVIQLKTSYNF